MHRSAACASLSSMCITQQHVPCLEAFALPQQDLHRSAAHVLLCSMYTAQLHMHAAAYAMVDNICIHRQHMHCPQSYALICSMCIAVCKTSFSRTGLTGQLSCRLTAQGWLIRYGHQLQFRLNQCLIAWDRYTPPSFCPVSTDLMCSSTKEPARPSAFNSMCTAQQHEHCSTACALPQQLSHHSAAYALICNMCIALQRVLQSAVFALISNISFCSAAFVLPRKHMH